MLLRTRTVEKPWGRDVLPPPFHAPEGKRIGEVWFEPPGELPELLVKHIFTGEPLSVQCHPSDAQTQAKGMGKQGKEECWLVIGAEPGAVLGIGFREAIDAGTMHEAALDGTIEHLLTWHPVAPGDFFYIPANTVHAIGAGVSVIEIQQNSDITYHLYDFGRPRELHLEQGLEVASGTPYDFAHSGFAGPGTNVCLVDGPYFRIDQVTGDPDPAIAARYCGNLLVIPRVGEVMLGSERIAPGSCALAEDIGGLRFAREGTCLLVAPTDV